MKIDEIEIRHTSLNLVHPFETSFGRFTERQPLVVKMSSGEHEGYGEAPTLKAPLYNSETSVGAFHVLEEYAAPEIVGEDIEGPDELHERLSFIRGNNVALAGLDTAFYSLLAEKEGMSLSDYLGGTKEKIPCGVSIGLQRDEEGNISNEKLLNRVKEKIEDSYRRIKIKIKPGFDVEPVEVLREELGSDFPLKVDANASYDLDDIEIFEELDNYDLTMIEQPFSEDDLIDHSKLQSEIDTPICLDESIESFQDVEKAIDLESMGVLNIKLSRVGGLYNAKRIHDLCEEEDIPVWCGGMVESGIGQAHSIALASLSNFKYPADIGPSKRYFEEDFIDPEILINEGYVDVPEDAGLGYDVDEDFLDRRTLRKETVYE